MEVSGQVARRQGDAKTKTKTESGPRVRTKRIMLDAAMRLMQDGLIPSVTDVAEEAQVSRATAYRYYPSQATLIQAAVDEALGPILAWQSESDDPEQRMGELLTFAYPRIEMYEATLRAALRLALDQWARGQAGKMGEEAAMTRGHRIDLLASAIAPLKKSLGRRRFARQWRVAAIQDQRIGLAHGAIQLVYPHVNPRSIEVRGDVDGAHGRRARRQDHGGFGDRIRRNR